MIHDSLGNFSRYLHVHRCFGPLLEFITSRDLEKFEPGEYHIYNGMKAIVSEYDTKDLADASIECHRKYIDMQLVLSGEEYVGVCRKENCTERTLYDPERDYQELSGEYSLLRLQRRFFMLFFPEDGHMPGIKTDKKELVKKVVFKIPVKL